MRLETLKLSELNPAEYNPRTITKEEFEGLKESLKTFGQQENLIVNKDMTIISGHQRYEAMKALGWTEAVCNMVDLDKHQEKKLNVIMNSTAISGKYDDLKLSEILEELKLDDDYESLLLDKLEPLDLAERNGGAMSTEERYDEIVQHYLSCEFTTRDIAEVYKISPRQIQRIVKLYGCTQNKAERMRIAWQKSKPLKEYNALSKSMKKGVRPQIKPKDRLTVLQRDNFTCQFCGAGKENQLHIDHINQDPKDNHLDNLRVLCAQCNYGRNGHYGSWRMELNTKYVDVIRKRYWKFTHDNNEEGWEDGTARVN